MFEFQVPPKLSSVEFILSGEIEYKTQNRKETLLFSKKYDFRLSKYYDILAFYYINV